MKFQPTAEELGHAITHLDDERDDQNISLSKGSGSKWRSEHLEALRVAYLDNLALERLFPSQFIPSDHHQAYSELVRAIRAPSEDDLKGSVDLLDPYSDNRFFGLFSLISEAIATRPAHIPGTQGAMRNPSPESDLSSSSAEDKDEEASRQMFFGLFNPITASLKHKPMEYNSINYRIRPNVTSTDMKLQRGENTVTVRNDGGLYLIRSGQYTGSNRYGTVPLVSFEAKRRHAGNIRRPGGENEKYSATVLAQEVAELLAQAINHNEQLGKTNDQESFVISIHGAVLRLSAARFDAAYLSHVKSGLVPAEETAWVRRSSPFNLRERDGREGALKLCIGLLEYLRSGEAEVGLLQQIFKK
ncbi:hypothetical protein L228DRAFT_243284 [Xylona heveae TC161]|uniref:Uncharacterized protein n=1 Tax=Xylona heveae (strain CBS 132557 / TC161) TaxID=1328760 RepID=A0A165JY10_XYLHT|nr:hypothetical protein L228DRAFT_243284 [Xylona heveae TC161]KZF26769.1 hypothetical protein L228DRAFT_243284 [Xylona heveae TC161]